MSESAIEVSKDDKDSGLEVLVFGADVNSDEACAQRSEELMAFIHIILYVSFVTLVHFTERQCTLIILSFCYVINATHLLTCVKNYIF